jgi:hypothetical protein
MTHFALIRFDTLFLGLFVNVNIVCLPVHTFLSAFDLDLSCFDLSICALQIKRFD